jgi:Ca2+-binding RTX toxin-like protein
MATHRLNSATTTTWMVDQTADTWILGSAGSITGTDITGILADNSIEEATIRVDGDIDLDGQTSIGVGLQTQMGAITVSDTGHVSADNTALYFQNAGGTATIDNAGVLQGEAGIYALGAQNSLDIGNSGRIHAFFGIGVAGAGATIINSGTIKADSGVFFGSGVGDTNPLLAENASHLVNSGKISGPTYSVQATEVAANIRNKGTLNGDVVLADGEDTFNNRGGRLNGDLFMGGGNDIVKAAGGTLKGVIHGGAGDDVVTLASLATFYVENAGQGIDTVRINSTYLLGENIENLTLLGRANHTGIGNSLDNTITGNKGANTLYGLDGGDGLDGGKGNDLLFGGGDNDIFVFKPGYGKDTIGDFEHGVDHIDLQAYQDIASFADLAIDDIGNDKVITFSDTDKLVIRDAAAMTLDGGDFYFHLVV